MLVQVNTDNHIKGHADLAEYVQTAIQSSLSRFEPQLVRVEVQLTDENSHKTTESDKRCVLEARLAGLQPLAVTADGSTIEQALDAAIDKMASTLDRRLGRLSDEKGRVPFGGEPGTELPS